MIAVLRQKQLGWSGGGEVDASHGLAGSLCIWGEGRGNGEWVGGWF